MDTASGLVFDVGHRIAPFGVLITLGVVAMAVTFLLVVAITGFLQPAPETVVLAPFRWRT